MTEPKRRIPLGFIHPNIITRGTVTPWTGRRVTRTPVPVPVPAPHRTVVRPLGMRTGGFVPPWRGRRSVLPLGDITDALRAIENQGTESPMLQQDQTPIDPTLHITGAPLEHQFPMMNPKGASPTKKSVPTFTSKFPKILLEISQSNKESEILAPQKKLLNSIDTVQKVVMEELNKQKRTPRARKAEGEKRVRTLMSMR